MEEDEPLWDESGYDRWEKRHDALLHQIEDLEMVIEDTQAELE